MRDSFVKQARLQFEKMAAVIVPDGRYGWLLAYDTTVLPPGEWAFCWKRVVTPIYLRAFSARCDKWIRPKSCRGLAGDAKCGQSSVRAA